MFKNVAPVSLMMADGGETVAAKSSRDSSDTAGAQTIRTFFPETWLWKIKIAKYLFKKCIKSWSIYQALYCQFNILKK